MWGRNRYHGQSLDLSTRRSISLLHDESAWVVENFYHNGRFWCAKIPHHVEHVYGQAFNFSRPKTRSGPSGPEVVYDKDGVPQRTLPGLNHVQCRFVMPPTAPVELYETAEDVATGQTAMELFDFVYSVEAIGPPGVRFNFRDGISGALHCAHRFLSTTEMVFERIALENQHVIQSAPLELETHEKQQLLGQSLARSHRAGATERYYLIGLCGTNNCTSNPFRILDQVVRYRYPYRLAAFIYRLPIRPRLYLRLRGLDVDPTHRVQLRQEFKAFLQSKEVRQRKRDFIRTLKRERQVSGRSGATD